jgi:hypothetical protein
MPDSITSPVFMGDTTASIKHSADKDMEQVREDRESGTITSAGTVMCGLIRCSAGVRQTCHECGHDMHACLTQALRQSQNDYEKDSKVQQLQKLMRSLQLQVG